MTTSPVADVLALLQSDPGSPHLTWYGPDGERIELSGAVLANWVAKTTNLLVEELGAGPGTDVALDLPAHWRALVWALSAWRTGATVHLAAPEDGTPVDVAVTDRPESWVGTAPDVVAVALPGLARSFGTDLPAGVIDAAADTMTYGDRIGAVRPTDPDVLALAPGVYRGAVAVSFQDLLDWAASSGVVTAPDRILVTADAQCTSCAHPEGYHAPAPDGLGRRGRLVATLQACLAGWAAGGSVVLLGSDATERFATPESRAHLVSTERIGA